MIVIKPSFEIEQEIDAEKVLASIERVGRTCYKSEDKIDKGSAEEFVRRVLKLGHESVIEHEKITVRIVCDRGVSHELVRHRMASYSQESTRYCNYGGEKHGREITVIEPCFWRKGDKAYTEWQASMEQAEKSYMALLDSGATPEEARSVLPNSLKTEIVVTMNLREWRHFFRLRTAKQSHPQMRELAQPMLEEFKRLLPVVFSDLAG